MQDYLLPELETLQASLALDMSSRTADKYTYYLSSLRDIVRHFPDDWQSETRSFVMCHPYAAPQEIILRIDRELSGEQYSSRGEVFIAVRNLAMTLIDVRDAVAESIRA